MSPLDVFTIILMALVYWSTTVVIYDTIMATSREAPSTWAAGVIAALWPVVVPPCVLAVVVRRGYAWVVGGPRKR